MSIATDNNCEKLGGDYAYATIKCANYYENVKPVDGKYVVCEENPKWKVIGGADNYCKRSDWSTCQKPQKTVRDGSDWTFSDII